MRFSAVLNFALLVSVVYAVPTGQRKTCVHQCSDQSLNYIAEQTLVYDYKATTSTVLESRSDESADLEIKAKVYITKSAPCEYTLKLSDVTLDGSSENTDFIDALTRAPMKYSMDKGAVEHICHDNYDPEWVVNFKKGIVSTLQTTENLSEKTETIQETDLTGKCETAYTFTTTETQLTVHKFKDAARCSHRPSILDDIPHTQYQSISPVKGDSSIDSKMNCIQTYENGLLMEASCKEVHLLGSLLDGTSEPLSERMSESMTTATTELKFEETIKKVLEKDFEFKLSSLLFETNKIQEESSLNTLRKLLDELETLIQEEIRPEVPAIFSELISKLKGLKYDQLKTLEQEYLERPAHKILVDAVPLVGTAAAAGLVRDMMKREDISAQEADAWFMELAFNTKPSLEMFPILASVLEFNPSHAAMLGISSLVNNYCSQHPTCDKTPEIQEVLVHIESHLGSACRATSQNAMEDVLVSLKALGNAGRWVNASPILTRCYTEDNEMEVRVAALQAWRHAPCEYDRSHLKSTFLDTNLDSEVRINAYLALMSCPTQELIEFLKDTLVSDGVNQVSSFVWTHLTNIKESAAPGKQWMQDLIDEELLKNKYTSETLKFSKNFESSFFMFEENYGATVESNIIFSERSFIPRSAMFNLTLDLFGKSINFFEIGGRAENFEMLIEKFFGEKGYYPLEAAEVFIKTMKEKRDVNQSELKNFLNPYENNPKGSFYLRLFGNELTYSHFRDINDIFKGNNFDSPFETLMQFAKSGKMDYTKSYQFMDDENTVPTITGLPLNVKLSGTASVKVKIEGDFKIKSLKDIYINGRILPSAAVSIHESMMVDAHYVQSGVNTEITAHTSTFLDGKMHIEGSNLVEFNVNMPKDKVEIMDVKTKFEKVEKNIKTELPKLTNSYATTCIGVPVVLGFTVCRDNFVSSNALEPYLNHNIYLVKTDTHSSYSLHFSKTDQHVVLTVDTPGSEVNRKWAVSLIKTENEFEVNLDSPFASMYADGKYSFTPIEKSVSGKLILNNDKRYSLDMSLQTTEEGIKKSHLIVSNTESDLIHFDGKLAYGGSNGGNIDLKLSSMYFSDLSFSGSYYRSTEKGLVIGGEISSKLFSASIASLSKVEKNLLTFENHIKYQLLEGETHKLDQYSMLSLEKGDNKWFSHVELVTNSSQLPIINMRLLSDIEIGNKYINSKNSLTIHNKKHELETALSGEYNLNVINYDIDLKYTSNNFGLKFKHDFLFSSDTLTSRMSAELPSFNIKSELTVQYDENFSLKYASNMKTTNTDIFTKANFEMTSPEVFDGKLLFKSNSEPNRQTLLNIAFKKASTKDSYKFEYEGTLDSPSKVLNTTGLMDVSYQGAEIKGVLNHQGKEYFLTFSVKPYSIELDAKLNRHVSLKAEIATEGDKRMEITAQWNKDLSADDKLYIGTTVSSKKVLTEFQFQAKKMTFSAEVTNNGAELFAQWAPDKKIHAVAQIVFKEDNLFSVTVETPFSGWEKQAVSFRYSVLGYNIKAKMAANWKNTDYASFTMSTVFDSNKKVQIATAFESSINSYESVHFSFGYMLNKNFFKANISGNLNNNQLTGKLTVESTAQGINSDFYFSSPFFEDVTGSLSHSIGEDSINSTLDFSFAEKIVKLYLKGFIQLYDKHSATFLLKSNSNWEIIPNINADLKYNFDSTKVNIEGNVNIENKRSTLKISGKRVATHDSFLLNGDTRFISPFTSPFKSRFELVQDRTFLVNFEVTEFWNKGGTLKLVIDGQIENKNNIKVNANILSSNIKSSLEFIHEYSGKDLHTQLNIYINEDNISLQIYGESLNDKSFTIRTNANSSYFAVEELRANLQFQNLGRMYHTQLEAFKGKDAYTVSHILEFNDIFNWMNSLTVNDLYKLFNKQYYKEGQFGHKLEYEFGKNYFNMLFNIGYMKNLLEFADITAKLTIDSSYSKNINANFNHKIDTGKMTNILTILYGHNNIISVNSDIKLSSSIGSGKISILYLSLDKVILSGNYNLQNSSIEANVSLDLPNEKRYYLNISCKGQLAEAEVSLKLMLPYDSFNNIEMFLKYKLNKMPFAIFLSFNKNNESYKAVGEYSGRSLNVNIDNNGRAGAITSQWSTTNDINKLNFEFKSPTDVIEDVSALLTYDQRNQRRSTVILQKGNEEVKLDFQLHKSGIIITGVTPFTGWDSIKVVVTLDDTNNGINVYLEKNNDIIKMQGNYNGSHRGGDGNVTVNSSYKNFEALALKFRYDFSEGVELFSTLTKNQVKIGSFSVSGKMVSKGVVKIAVNLFTPLKCLKHVSILTDFGLSDDQLIFTKFNGNYNDLLNVNSEVTLSRTKSYITAKIINIKQSKELIKMSVNYDFTTTPFTAFIALDKNAVRLYSVSATVMTSKFTLEIKTPIDGWEVITSEGTYLYNETSFSGNMQIAKNTELYTSTIKIYYDNGLTCKISMGTPIAKIKTIEYSLDTNLMSSVNMSLKLNHHKFNFNGHYSRSKRNLVVQLQTNIKHYKHFKLEFIFDKNKLDFSLHSPFTIMKRGELHVQLQTNTNPVILTCSLLLNKKKFLLEGQYDTTAKKGDLSLTSTDNAALLISVIGSCNNNKSEITVKILDKAYFLTYEHLKNDRKFIINLRTPMESFETFRLVLDLENFNNININLDINEKSYSIFYTGNYSLLKSELRIKAILPYKDWKTTTLEGHYNFLKDHKIIEATLKKSTNEVFACRIKLNPHDGSIYIIAPITGYEVISSHYTLSVNENYREILCEFVLEVPKHNYEFSLSSQYDENSLNIEIITPFSNFEKILLNVALNVPKNFAKFNILVGAYELTGECKFTLNMTSIKVDTPFSLLRNFTFKYEWLDYTKYVYLYCKTMEKIFQLESSLEHTQPNKVFNVSVITPFEKFDQIGLKARWNFEDTLDLLSIQGNINERTYGITFGGEFDSIYKFGIMLGLVTPFTYMKEGKIIIKVDVSQVIKHVKVVLEHNGKKTELSFTGKISDDTADMNLILPFHHLENVSIMESLNREKRSFRSSRDASRGIFESFQSLRIDVSSGAEKPIALSLEKQGERGFLFDWKRGSNYAKINYKPDAKQVRLTIEVKSKIPGWEFLALAGKLNYEEVSAFLSGQRNSDMVSIEGKGSFRRNGGQIQGTIKTPFKNFMEMNISLVIRASSIKFNAVSTSSNFKVIYEDAKDFTLNIVYPNPTQDTKLSIVFSQLGATIDIESRFPCLRNFHYKHSLDMSAKISVNIETTLNSLKIFELDLNIEPSKEIIDLVVHGRWNSNHSQLHFGREGWNVNNLKFERNGKQFQAKITGSGSIPTKGTLDVDILNTFREIPRKITGNIILDRTGRPKTAKMEISVNNKLYIVDAKYNIDLSKASVGDYKIHITTPERKAAKWKDMGGAWDVKSLKNVFIEFSYGPDKYALFGKLLPNDIDIQLNLPMLKENLILEYNYESHGTYEHVMMKYGFENDFSLVKIEDDVQPEKRILKGSYKMLYYMKHILNFESTWKKSSDGTILGTGNFDYGNYKGSYNAKYYKPQVHEDFVSASFEWEGTSTVPNFRKVTLVGKYEIGFKKIIIKGSLDWDDVHNVVDINFSDFNSEFSKNTAVIELTNIGKYELTVTHDFKNKLDKNIQAILKRPKGKECSFKAHWTRTADFSKLSGKAELKNDLIGNRKMEIDYDFSNINDVNGKILYYINEKIAITVELIRMKTSNHLHGEASLTTTLSFLPNIKYLLHAEFKDDFKGSISLEVANKKVELSVLSTHHRLEGTLLTPWENFERIEGTLEYNIFSKNQKDIKFHYKRGDKRVDLEFNLTMKGKKSGSLSLLLTTPFELVKMLNINAEIKKGKAQVKYRRNDIEYNFSGTAEFRNEKASFDIALDKSSNKKLHLVFDLNLNNLSPKSDSKIEKLLAFLIEIDEIKAKFDLSGYRSDSGFAIDAEGSSNLEKFKVFKLKLEDIRVNKEERKVNSHWILNDRYFISTDILQVFSDGYYYKSSMQSSLTPLPGLTIGYGRKTDEKIFTIGLGDEREFTVSFKETRPFTKDSWGIAGKYSLPFRGIKDAPYEAEYSFKDNDNLHIHIMTTVRQGKQAHINIDYVSEGVRARLLTPLTGLQYLRFRRSITPNGFSSEIGYNDYSLDVKGDFYEDQRKGLHIEGTVFGKPVSIDTYLNYNQGNNISGKLAIQTSIQGLEKIGGSFSMLLNHDYVNGKVSINIPLLKMPFDAEFDGKLAPESVSYSAKVTFSDKQYAVKGQLSSLTLNNISFHIDLKNNKGTLFYITGTINYYSSYQIKSEIDMKIHSHIVTIEHEHNIGSDAVLVYLRGALNKLVYKVGINLSNSNEYKSFQAFYNNNNIFIKLSTTPKMLINLKIDVPDLLKKHFTFTAEGSRPSLLSVHGFFEFQLVEKKHIASIDYEAYENNVKGRIEVHSDSLDSSKLLSIELRLPSFQQPNLFMANANLVGKDKHMFLLKVDMTNNFIGKFIAVTPVFDKVEMTFSYDWSESAELNIKTQMTEHKLKALWLLRKDINESIKNAHGKLEFYSNIYQNYSLEGTAKLIEQIKEVDITGYIGAKVFRFNGSLMLLPREHNFKFAFKSPVEYLRDIGMNFKLQLNEKLISELMAFINGEQHAFMFSLDKEPKILFVSIASNLIPTKVISVEGALTGSTPNNMEAYLSLKTPSSTYSGTLKILIKSTKDVSATLQLRTPFSGYEGMRYGVVYFIGEESIHASAYAAKPFTFKGDIYISHKTNAYTYRITAETPFLNYKKIFAEVYIPRESFAPMLSFNILEHTYQLSTFYRNENSKHSLGAEYSTEQTKNKIEIGVKSKVPYEFKLNISSFDEYCKFHIRMDSSIMAALTLLLPL